MKKLFALMMALLLGLSCFGAVAEEGSFNLPAVEVPNVTATGAVTIDQDQLLSLLPMFGVDEDMLGMVKAVLPVASNLGCRVTLNNGAQIDVQLKGQDVASAALAVTDDGLTVVSDVIPSYVLTLSKDTIQQFVDQIVEQMKAMLGEVDLQAIMERVMGYAQQFLMEAMTGFAMGEPEAAEVTVNEYTFNTKLPISVDVKVLAKAIVGLVQNLKNDEVIAPLLSAADVTLSVDEDTLAQIESTPEDQLPTLNADVYTITNEDGTTEQVYYAEAVLDTKNEEVGQMNVTALIENQNVNMALSIPSQNVTVTFENIITETYIGNAMNADIAGMYFGDFTNVYINEDGIQMEEELYVMNTDAPLMTANMTVVPGGELTLSFDAEGKTVLPIEQLIADEEGEAANGLMIDAMSNGLNGVLAKAAEAMPEEVTALINLFTGAGEAAIAE
jgi:hypothetical protein